MQPARDRISPAEGIFPEDDMKHRLALAHADLPIAVSHRELIQIRQKRQRGFVELRKCFHNVAWAPEPAHLEKSAGGTPTPQYADAMRYNLPAMAEKRKKAVILLSGGLDSATALAIARSDGFACHCLSFRYGQRHEFELEAAQRVARSLGAEQHVIAQIDLRMFGGS